MKEFQYTIKDKLGMHARPVGLFVKAALTFPCKITIQKGNREADAKKVFAVMGLDVECGDEITVRAEGEQEEEAAESLGRFFAENL